ncbi:MAG: hypothetical protein M1830_002393, partial [Pleopsidium flavum]
MSPSSNNTFAGDLQPSSPSSSASNPSDLLDFKDDEGWEDAEPEDEDQEVRSLFSTEIFPNIGVMLQDCKDRHGFDFMWTTKELGLDFYGTIRLVNYIRSEVNAGNTKLHISSKAVFEDDKYLKPVLEDDALLFGLDDVIGGPSNGATAVNGHGNGNATDGSDIGPLSRVVELEEELQRLQSQFLEYRETVRETLDDRWNDKDSLLSSHPNHVASSAPIINGASGAPAPRDDDSHYFTSYSYN